MPIPAPTLYPPFNIVRLSHVELRVTDLAWSRAYYVDMLGLQVTIREQALELYRPFIHDNRFIFESENIRAGYALLRAEDRIKLPWTPEKIDWRHYWSEHEVKGIRKWVEAETTKGWSFKI